MADVQSIRNQIYEAREACEAELAKSHLDASTRDLLYSFSVIADITEGLLTESGGYSADSRVWKKRHDVVKQELKDLQKQAEAQKELAQNKIFPALKVVVQLSHEISTRYKDDNANQDGLAAQKILKAAQDIVGALK